MIIKPCEIDIFSSYLHHQNQGTQTSVFGILQSKNRIHFSRDEIPISNRHPEEQTKFCFVYRHRPSLSLFLQKDRLSRCNVSFNDNFFALFFSIHPLFNQPIQLPRGCARMPFFLGSLQQLRSAYL